jgi:hypothetical protein
MIDIEKIIKKELKEVDIEILAFRKSSFKEMDEIFEVFTFEIETDLNYQEKFQLEKKIVKKHNIYDYNIIIELL